MIYQDECTMEMIETALDMEKKGRAFYEKAAETCQNELGREIFLMLMKDEAEHINRIQKISEVLSSGRVCTLEWKTFPSRLSRPDRLFEQLAKKQGKNISPQISDLEALSIGIDMELQSLKYYEDQHGRSNNQLEKEFLRRMISEERSHYLALSDMNFYLTNPEAWFTEHEHQGLDGA